MSARSVRDLSLALVMAAWLIVSAESGSPSNRFKEAPQFYNSPDCPPPPPDEPSALCSPSAVHIAMTLDSPYLRGSMAAILSILQHSSCPQNVAFHFVTSPSNASEVRSAVAASFPYLWFETIPFEPSHVSRLISASIRPALDSPLNYARSYLPSLLPSCLSKVVYLDSDLVLVDDIAELASTRLPPPLVLAAPEYCKANLTSYFTPAFWSDPELSSVFNGRKPCYFNTGVMVIDLDRRRAGLYTEQIKRWMEVQKRVRIYVLGSLPPFLLMFGGRIAGVDHRWNQHGLGGDNYQGLVRDLHPGPVSLLCWSGKGKPWTRLNRGRPCLLDALWAPYDLSRPTFDLD